MSQPVRKINKSETKDVIPEKRDLLDALPDTLEMCVGNFLALSDVEALRSTNLRLSTSVKARIDEIHVRDVLSVSRILSLIHLKWITVRKMCISQDLLRILCFLLKRGNFSLQARGLPPNTDLFKQTTALTLAEEENGDGQKMAINTLPELSSMCSIPWEHCRATLFGFSELKTLAIAPFATNKPLSLLSHCSASSIWLTVERHNYSMVRDARQGGLLVNSMCEHLTVVTPPGVFKFCVNHKLFEQFPLLKRLNVTIKWYGPQSDPLEDVCTDLDAEFSRIQFYSPVQLYVNIVSSIHTIPWDAEKVNTFSEAAESWIAKKRKATEKRAAQIEKRSVASALKKKKYKKAMRIKNKRKPRKKRRSRSR